MTATDQILNQLRPLYFEDVNTFDFKISMFLAGKSNQTRRQEIIKDLTGVKPPATKASLGAVTNVIKNTFDSPKLF